MNIQKCWLGGSCLVAQRLSSALGESILELGCHGRELNASREHRMEHLASHAVVVEVVGSVLVKELFPEARGSRESSLVLLANFPHLGHLALPMA